MVNRELSIVNCQLSIDQVSLKDAVIGRGTDEFAVMYAYALDGTLEAYLAVGHADNLLVEHALDAVACDIELGAELIAAAQRGLVVECHLGDDKVVTGSTHIGKAEADGEEELMTRVLQVVLVVGVVDDALEVAFVVAHLHEQFVAIFFHRSVVLWLGKKESGIAIPLLKYGHLGLEV